MAAKTISVEQRFELLAKLGANINWDALDSGAVQRLIDKPRDPGAQMTQFIKNGGRMELVVKQLVVWKTITVQPKSGEEFIAELEQASIEFTSLARDIVGKPAFRTLNEPKTLKLAKVTVRDLGFTEEPTMDEIWARIEKLGGELCPPEAGLEIRKNHDDQKNGTAFWIAMKQISDSGGDLRIFYVGCNDDGRRYLGALYAFPNLYWRLDDEIVFAFRE